MYLSSNFCSVMWEEVLTISLWWIKEYDHNMLNLLWSMLPKQPGKRRGVCEGACPGKYYHHTYFCRKAAMLCSGLKGLGVGVMRHFNFVSGMAMHLYCSIGRLVCHQIILKKSCQIYFILAFFVEIPPPPPMVEDIHEDFKGVCQAFTV